MDKVKEVALEAGFDVEINNQRADLLLITLNHMASFSAIASDAPGGFVTINIYNRHLTINPQEIEDLTPVMLRAYMAMIDRDYACEVYAPESRKEIKKWSAQTAEMAAEYKTLEKKYNRVREKYRGLKEHLKYAPDGPGAAAAQAHFEAILPQ